MSKTLTTMLAALATALATAAVSACGGTAPAALRTTPAASAPAPAAAAPANPFANWSAPCQKIAADLRNAGYTYTASGTSANWSQPSSMTYGDMVALAVGSQGADGQGSVPGADDFAHLSYVETTMGNSQAANDLGTASTGVFSYLPRALQGPRVSGRLYNRVMRETASASALSGWASADLVPVLNDCQDGIG
jgi:hypothetical protein